MLLKLLERRIADEKFLSLIRSMLKAGFLENWTFNLTHSGTPQGGIISPLLANVYLHELDLFMEEYISRFNKGIKRARHPEHHSVSERARYLRKKIAAAREAGREDEARELMAKHDVVRAQLHTMPSVDPMDSNYKRLRYVRYADDFLMGVIGSKAEAREVLEAVRAFLTTHLNLEVSAEKSGIHKATERVRFLGYDLWSWTGDRKVVMHIAGHRGLKRSVNEKIKLSLPREKVAAFTTKNGYGQYEVGVGTHRNGLIHCDDVELVRIYNAELRGFANYYALAYDVKRKLSKLYLIWQQSLFKTMAAKHKSSVAKMACKCKVSPGRYVVKQEVKGKVIKVALWNPRDLVTESKVEWLDAMFNKDSVAYMKTRYVDRATAVQCSHCGTTEGPFHIHHVNPLRTVKSTNRWLKVAQSRLRKTTVLCVECHLQLHAGSLPDRRGQVDGNGEPDDAKVSCPVRWEGEGYSP